MNSPRVTLACGFPHSEIPGSKLICSSPRLIAACHVLLRLLMPRHSPYALFRLNFLLYSLFSELLEFLRKQDKFRIEKVYPFRVVCFPPFGEIVIVTQFFGKTQSLLINCVLFICSFFQLI